MLNSSFSASTRADTGQSLGLQFSGMMGTSYFETVNEKLDKLIEWQENQRDKPGRRWESLVEKAVWAVQFSGMMGTSFTVS